ncbi:MAG TPA: branched-chain amino acid ABC transporter permease [Desertimonas sp.]|nr:branched-chain amino acid ABC transporter permease [Desertimonas sp.]
MPVKVHWGSPAHWAIRLLWVAATIALIMYIPTRAQPSTISDMTTALELATVAMALNLVMGFGGLISLGHSAYFGLGAYTMAVLVDHYGWTQGWTLYIAAVVGFVVGCLTSLPALRLKGVYLALTSIALAVLFPQLVKWRKLEWLTDGARGIDDLQYDDIPEWPILGELDGRRGRAVWMYWLAVIIAVVSYLICRGVVKSRVGRSLVAIRDNETAAAVMGVNRARTQTIVYGLSAAMTAVAGALFGIGLNGVNPDLRYFTLIGSITFVVIMVIGGGATLWGPIVGAFVYVLVENRTREWGAESSGIIGVLFGWLNSSPATFILAVALLVLMFVAPFGIVGLLKRLAAKALVVVPRPAGTRSNVPPVEEGLDPTIDEPFLPASPEETP